MIFIEGAPGAFDPGPPSTGAHGGGGLYRQGKDRPCIAARFPGGFVPGAAAPRAARIGRHASGGTHRAARIGITRQALRAAALYRPGPPGRRRCHAAEIQRRLRWRAGGASGMPRPTWGRTCVCARPEPRGRYNVSPLGRKAACRTAWWKIQKGGRNPLFGRFKGWVQGGGNRNPPPCWFSPRFCHQKRGRRRPAPPLRGRPQVAPTNGAPGRRALRIRADTIRPYPSPWGWSRRL